MRLIGCFCVALFALPACAEIVVNNPWAPPSLSQPNAVGFMGLKSDAADALVGASSDSAGVVELHTHIIENDVIRMRQVEKIDLPANQEVLLRPGSFHLMLIGLRAPLTDGMSVPVTLKFRDAPDQEILLEVDRARLLDRLKSPKH